MKRDLRVTDEVPYPFPESRVTFKSFTEDVPKLLPQRPERDISPSNVRTFTRRLIKR